jgi:hypothetical protein
MQGGWVFWLGLKSFAVQDVGLVAPCVKEQGETPFDCGPNQGEYCAFAGSDSFSPPLRGRKANNQLMIQRHLIEELVLSQCDIRVGTAIE